MTPQEADKIIAEYMGIVFMETDDNDLFIFDAKTTEPISISGKYYSESLDALVPVWKQRKIDVIKILTECYSTPNQVHSFVSVGVNEQVEKWFYGRCHESTIQEAAAIATAKAIRELDK